MSEGMNEGRKNMKIADNQCKETNFSPRRKKGKRGDRNYLVNFGLYNSARNYPQNSREKKNERVTWRKKEDSVTVPIKITTH